MHHHYLPSSLEKKKNHFLSEAHTLKSNIRRILGFPIAITEKGKQKATH